MDCRPPGDALILVVLQLPCSAQMEVDGPLISVAFGRHSLPSFR